MQPTLFDTEERKPRLCDGLRQDDEGNPLICPLCDTCFHQLAMGVPYSVPYMTPAFEGDECPNYSKCTSRREAGTEMIRLHKQELATD